MGARRAPAQYIRCAGAAQIENKSAILFRLILTYHDGACVRASAGDTTLVFGPVSKDSKHFKPTNFGADVAFVSFNHPDMNGVEEAGRGDKQPFVVLGPGEYEV